MNLARAAEVISYSTSRLQGLDRRLAACDAEMYDLAADFRRLGQVAVMKIDLAAVRLQ